MVACAAMAGLSQAQAVTVEKPSASLNFKAFNPSDTVYLFNVKAELFYTSGNAYSTQTSIGTEAIPCVFKAYDDESYILWDLPTVKTQWMSTYIVGTTIPGTSYTDEQTVYPSSTGVTPWKVIDKGDNVYRLQTTQPDLTEDVIGETYFGWDGGDNTIVSPLLDMAAEDAANYGVDWKFIAADTTVCQLFAARTALYEQMVTADEAGISYDYTSVYNGTDVDAINAAAAELETKIVNAKLENASDDNPVDVTELIKNADCLSMDGWTFEQTGNGNWQTQGASYENGDAYLKGFIESWAGSYTNILGDRKMYQTLTGLPAGSYELGCDAIASYQADASVTPTGGYLYGNSYQTTMSTANGVPEHFTVGIVLSEGENLEIGAKVESCNFNWFGVDNFTLTYYGKGTMALRNSLQSAIDQASELDGAQAYEEYLDKLSEAIENAQTVLDNPSASADELTAALQALNEAVDLVNTNISLYDDLEEEVQNANDLVNDLDPEQYTEVETLGEYLSNCDDADGNDLNDVIASTSVDNETVETIIAKLQSLEKKALYSGIVAGADITGILADPTFDNGGQGSGFAWEGLVTVDANYHNCEAWNTNFNTYQTLTDLPNGVYTLKIQAFQRMGTCTAADATYYGGDTSTTAILYTNDNTANIKNIFDDAQDYDVYNDSTDGAYAATTTGTWPNDYLDSNGKYTPNCMQSTMFYMNMVNEDGTPKLYDNTISALVTDGKLTFGIKCDDMSNYKWVIFDNIRLYFEGSDAETLSAMVEELANTVEGLKEQPMCADSLNAMTAALKACQNNTTGGDELIAQMVTLQQAINAARNSISAYAPLVTTIAWAQATAAANERTNGETAKQQLDNLETDMNNGAFQDADIDNTIIEVKRTANQYLMSDIVANAESYSAENPAECSFVIQNATFEDNTADAWTAEVGSPGVAYHCYEMYNQNFDVKQILYGMPAGSYRLEVTGFYRDGWNDGLAQKVAEETWADNVVIVINTDSQAMARIVDGAADITDWTLESEDYYLYDEDNSLYIPNNMQNAEQWLINETTAPLLTASAQDYNYEGADMVIGMTKTTTDNGDWTIVKGWKLYYLGLDPDAVEAIDATAGTVMSQQIFNASGAQQSRLQKGVNILKQKMSDGTTRVKKVIVK